ncbi:hypothetical protein CROQUDRAFT_651347 [Cronartium quercuum f. sp. fusiforme G11]|uniref:Succinate dehydrogenase assembly factor 4, mitochondrial n=1 Tax=Cronartium quercuum f. sp. fusiforme G11 TaxID=708437 RepID=A0A9P6TGM0_9BASI|nr:hypothetical protein CROQUDRAFT_651347 [Cronartium quercuum f. sp. fusiforme G11]
MTFYSLRFKFPIRLFGHRPFSALHGPRSNVPKAPFSRPSPPPLPAKDQAEFERLVKQQQTPFASPTQAETEMHPDLRPKPAPEFEGEVNPKTGEVGGPKRDPLKWEREWAYGGRATDF